MYSLTYMFNLWLGTTVLPSQIFLLVPAVTAVCDLIYTIVEGRTGSVAEFQYVTPIVIIVSMVSYYFCRICKIVTKI